MLTSGKMYLRHPSPELQRLFAARPYQGADPRSARFVFVGLDANYDANVDRTPFFARIREYHEDGPSFWRRYGVHHPFLLPEYRGDGRFYHQSFARTGFMPSHADHVSFVELAEAPTVGRNQLDLRDLNPLHIAWLSEVLWRGKARYIFMPSAVLRLLRRHSPFTALPSRASGTAFDLPLLLATGDKHFLAHQHFSAYGKSTAQKRLEAEALWRLARTEERRSPAESWARRQ